MRTIREQLEQRSMDFALRIIQVARALPNEPVSWVISKQMLRSATSVAANYRAAGRARSRAEFAAKMGTVVEEADETAFWLEMLLGSGLVKDSQVSELRKESNELISIFVSVCKKAKRPLEISSPATRL